MSKPEGIDQATWDEAIYALYGQAPDEWVRAHVVLISRCARALIAAKEKEREACAKLVQRFNGHAFPNEIASAIRARATP